MIPAIKLGPGDSPSLEILRRDIYPIIAVMLEHGCPNPEAIAGARSFVYLDGIFLSDFGEEFFVKLEDICRLIVDGEVHDYDVDKLGESDFGEDLKIWVNSGLVTPEVKDGARRVLAFLAANPDYWPPPRSLASG
jgi:hypothetical protein